MKIKVEPLLPTGSYLNVRIGIEYDIPDMVTDAIIKGQINSSWDLLVSIHRERYPHLYNEDGTAKYEMYKGEEMKGTHVRDVVEEPVDEVKTTLEAIGNCNTMDELKGYWLISKGNLTYSQAYKEREKQLKNEK